MSAIYRKTGKGLAEIATREHRLPPRLRQALILVDGRRRDDELAAMIGAEAPSTLTGLLDSGFIELAETKPEPAKRETSPTPASPTRRPASIESLKRDAVRALNDQMGPGAESIAIRIERAKSQPELQPLLVQAAQMLRATRGAAAADALALRFIEGATHAASAH